LRHPQIITRIAESAHITMAVGYLPKRSPIGPMKSWLDLW
jgi:hypothetical protein